MFGAVSFLQSATVFVFPLNVLRRFFPAISDGFLFTLFCVKPELEATFHQ